MTSKSLQDAEGVILVALIVAVALLVLVRRLAGSRPGLRIGTPIAVAFGLRLAAIAGIAATGSLSAVLRGGDETTYLDLAHFLASQPHRGENAQLCRVVPGRRRLFLLLHAALRSMNRPGRAMPAIYAVALIAVLATPAVLQASSNQNLEALQQSQNANASGAGQGSGANGSNLALEQVDFSTRGAILRNLPKRVRDVVLKPYPWQLADTSQRIGALGTLVAYAVLVLLIRYAWLNRGQILPRAGPVLYPLLFLLIAYSLSAGNAGTGFRYRSHLVTLAIAALVILREHVVLARTPALAPDASAAAVRSQGLLRKAHDAPGIAMTPRSGGT